MDQDPLLPAYAPVEGAVDHRGCQASRSNSGRWTSACFIIGVEVAERFAYFGVSSNLITYLTGPLGLSTAAAAANVNAWSGASSMLPLPLGLVADWWVGRYRLIVAASLLYILGLGMLTTLVVALSLRPPGFNDATICEGDNFHIKTFFFFSIYLISLAQGGHKPCVQAFGADQFDENDPEECKSKSSFFNWWYFGMCFGTVFPVMGLNYIQESIGWGLGFGIPFISMILALGVFLLGTKTYRFYLQPNKSPFITGKVAKRLMRGDNQRSAIADESFPLVITDYQAQEQQSLLTHGESRYVDPCASLSANNEADLEQKFEEGEGLGAVMKLFPIWAMCLVYGVVFSQSSTFFTKQGSTLDRRIGQTFQVPAAALQSFISISIVIFIPIYDLILVPITRKFTGRPSGMTLLHRIGIGMFLSMVAMVIAALVEIKRLQIAKECGLIDSPGTPIPMSWWWLAPQYLLFGIADVFTMIGLQEFFYDQVPNRFRSLGLALYLSIFGVGSFISSALVSIIDKASTKGGGDGWFPNNLNRAHLDYFYWLLATLGAAQLLLYLGFSRRYRYK